MRNKKGYVIKCLKNTKNGFITEFLGLDSKWYIACNNVDHKTLEQAQNFFKHSNYELRGSSIWIEGPRGGRHSLFNKGLK